MILGGAKARSEADVLRSVKEAINCGGAGVVMGRNIWQNRSPGKFTAALFSIIHEGASVEDALKLLD
jgi:class I fructose-bisphosphate aldolase